MYYELLRQTLYHLRQYKLRNAMVIFGIAWGTLSVVLLMSLGTSFHKNMMTRFNAIVGPDTQSFTLTFAKHPDLGNPGNRRIHLQADAVMKLRQQIPGIKSISPLLASEPTIAAGSATSPQVLVFGVSADWPKLLNLNFSKDRGHFFTPLALAQGNYDVVIDNTVATAFFKKQSPVGQTLLIKGVPFHIIGVSDSSFQPGRMHVFIPYTTFQKLWKDDDSYVNFFTVHQPQQLATVKQAIVQILSHELVMLPSDVEAAFETGTAAFRDTTNALFIKLQSFFILSGGLALLIGGLGVANIMFLTINQRSREIGLTMALGAQDKHILSQILLEAFLLVISGGFLGFLLSGLIIVGLRQFPALPFGHPTLPVGVFVLTVGVLALLGLLAGYFPARKAMRLNPVEAFNKVG